MPYCRRCGEELGSGAAACPTCGSDQDSTQGDRHTSGTPPLAGRTLLTALIGGTVAFTAGLILAVVFTPFYVFGIFLGGAVAGYLFGGKMRDGAIVGLLSGLLATAPIVLLLFVGSLLGSGWMLLSVQRHVDPINGGPLLVGGLLAVLLLVVILSTVTNAMFGTLGGTVGSALSEEVSLSFDRHDR